MLCTARGLSELIGMVYDAGLDTTGARWRPMLERLSSDIGGGGSAVIGVERLRYAYAQVQYVGIDADSVALYRSYYAGIDPVFEPRMPAARPGDLMLSDALLPARELRRTEFDADWLRPRDLGIGAAAILVRDGGAEAGLYMVRPRRRGAFTRDGVDALHLLLPHLAAAVCSSLRLAEMEQTTSAMVELIDHVSQAVLLVDGQSRVHVANVAAESLLLAADAISLVAGASGSRARLQARTPYDTAALRRMIADLSVTSAEAPTCVDRPAPAARTLALARGDLPSLAVLAVPLRRDGMSAPWLRALHDVAGRATVALFVTDSLNPRHGGMGTRNLGDRLRGTYHLTRAETAVALSLASGDGLAAAADAHGVTMATARTHALHVYRKTRVRGQAALARLVERLASVR